MTNYKHYYLVGEYKHIGALDKIGNQRFYPVIKNRKPKNYLTEILAQDLTQAINFLILDGVIKRKEGYLVFDTGLFNSKLVDNFAC